VRGCLGRAGELFWGVRKVQSLARDGILGCAPGVEGLRARPLRLAGGAFGRCVGIFG
jgi:hypothetical protein